MLPLFSQSSVPSRDNEREPSPAGTVIMEPIGRAMKGKGSAGGDSSMTALGSANGMQHPTRSRATTAAAGWTSDVAGSPPPTQAAPSDDPEHPMTANTSQRCPSDASSPLSAVGRKRFKAERSSTVDASAVPKPDERRFSTLENAASNRSALALTG